MTGIELITKERKEQIEKHGRDKEHDSNHDEEQLKEAAMFSIRPYDDLGGINLYEGWQWFTMKVREKTEIERLTIAGALIAAEIDRLKSVGE